MISNPLGAPWALESYTDFQLALEPPDHEWQLITYGEAWKSCNSYDLLQNPDGTYRARWHGDNPIYMAYAIHCGTICQEITGCQELCLISQPNYFNAESDGIPLPESSQTLGLFLSFLLTFLLRHK